MLQIAMNMPKAVTGLFQGLLLFYLLTCDAFIHYRIRLKRRVRHATTSAVMTASGEA